MDRSLQRTENGEKENTTSTNAIEEQCPPFLTSCCPWTNVPTYWTCLQLDEALDQVTLHLASCRGIETKFTISKQPTGGPVRLIHGPLINLSSTSLATFEVSFDELGCLCESDTRGPSTLGCSGGLWRAVTPEAVPVSLAGVRHSSTDHLPLPSAVQISSSLRTRAVTVKGW